jgi:hypothetical protein
MRELGHKFAFSSESVEFLGGIHRLASLSRLWTFALDRRAICFEGASRWLSRGDKRIRPQRRVCGSGTRQKAFGSDQLVSSVSEDDDRAN